VAVIQGPCTELCSKQRHNNLSFLLFTFLKTQSALLLLHPVALFLISEARAKVLFSAKKFFKCLFQVHLCEKDFLLIFLAPDRKVSSMVAKLQQLPLQVFALACVRKK
jgi:hypothetical protein